MRVAELSSRITLGTLATRAAPDPESPEVNSHRLLAHRLELIASADPGQRQDTTS